MEELKQNYNHLNTYLKEKYGDRTLKICIDGGFTCPNRDGFKAYGGCIFCGEKGSGEHINPQGSLNNIQDITSSITKQVQNYLLNPRASRAKYYIAYFQNFTNTYDSIQNLKSKYDSALINSRIKVLSVATRPDCINEEICKLLASYKSKLDVWVELGLQTANNEIGKKINRGYDSEEFTKAVNLLNKYNLETICHIIVGLPGESDETIDETISFLNNHNIQGLKIHSCYIIKNSILNDMYIKGDYSPITLEYYIKTASKILTHINPNIIIHKISGDAPKDLLVAPEWNLHKKWILNGIDKYLRENNLYQGMFFTKI